MKHQEIRETLIRNTIAVIANEGLDRTTTKAIVRGTNINEAYIYRFFEDKIDLMAKAFAQLDEELLEKAVQHVAVMGMREMDFETRCKLYFTALWNFLLQNREKCLAYVRYYYSPYFMSRSEKEHFDRFTPVVEEFSKGFKSEANTRALLEHALNAMLDFAVKVLNGLLPNDDDSAEHIFRVVYNSVKDYLKV